MFDYTKGLEEVAGTDVLVVGGGPAGIGAAVACARLGMQTILVERYGFLGGMATAAMVHPFMTSYSKNGKVQVVRGVFDELVRKLESEGGAIHPSKVEPGSSYAAFQTADHDHVTPFEPETLKKVSAEFCISNRVVLRNHSLFVDAFLAAESDFTHPETGKAVIAVIASKSGLQAIGGRIVIDCTGDADVVERLGLKVMKGREPDSKMQPGSMMFRIRGVDEKAFSEFIRKAYPGDMKFNRPLAKEIEMARQRGEFSAPKDYVYLFKSVRNDEWFVNGSRVLGVDGTNVESLSRAEVEGRQQVFEIVRFLNKYVPGCENVELMDAGSQIGIRETRRMKGRYVLEEEDVIKCRPFEDAVASYAYGLDIHDPSGGNSLAQPIEGEAYQIPYRCLLPEEDTQLLVAGRCISCSHEAMSAIRVMPCGYALGEAAGTAAALSLKQGILPTTLDFKQLQDQLRKQGAYIGDGREPV